MNYTLAAACVYAIAYVRDSKAQFRRVPPGVVIRHSYASHDEAMAARNWIPLKTLDEVVKSCCFSCGDFGRWQLLNLHTAMSADMWTSLPKELDEMLYYGQNYTQQFSEFGVTPEQCLEANYFGLGSELERLKYTGEMDLDEILGLPNYCTLDERPPTTKRKIRRMTTIYE